MALAVFEAYFSRPIAPTRRLALGEMDLPADPAPGFGGVLLGAVMARFGREIDEDTDEALDRLIDDLESGRRVGQPRVRHRLQGDRVGLTRCRHRLESHGGGYRFRFDERAGTPTQHVIAAAYAAATVPTEDRRVLFASVRKGLDWVGPIDDSLVRFLSDRRSLNLAGAGSDPRGWALDRLGLSRSIGGVVGGDDLHALVAQSFRTLLIEVHPDHGGAAETAALDIAELREARRILLGR